MISPDGDNLVFLLSLPRSGSTILSLLLGSHSAMLCPPEPWFLLKLSALRQPGNINSAFDDDWATAAASQFLQDGTFLAAARAFATTAYNQHLGAANKRVFIDKTPRYYHILPFVDTLFSRARKVWLRRNPLDVALSYMNSWGAGIETITGEQVSSASFDFAVGPFTLADYFDVSSPFKLAIRYEDLVRNPTATLVQVCDFLGVEYEETMLDYAQNEEVLSQYANSLVGDEDAPATTSVHSGSVGKWAKGLQAEEIQQIVNLLGVDIFRRMGYEDTVATLPSMGIEIPSEEDAAEARRRVADSHNDRTIQLYEELAAIRERGRSRRAIALILRRARLDGLLRRVVR